MGKERGSVRINRYEHEVTAIGFDSLEKMAETLEVPAAYLLADSARMAEAILALSHANEIQLDALADLIPILIESPELLQKLVRLLQGSETTSTTALEDIAKK